MLACDPGDVAINAAGYSSRTDIFRNDSLAIVDVEVDRDRPLGLWRPVIVDGAAPNAFVNMDFVSAYRTYRGTYERGPFENLEVFQEVTLWLTCADVTP